MTPHASCCKTAAPISSMVMPMDMAGFLPGRTWAAVDGRALITLDMHPTGCPGNGQPVYFEVDFKESYYD